MLYLLEIGSVVLVLCYLYFAVKQQANAWLFGMASSTLSMVLFYQNGYFGSMVLNGIYILQGASGYFHWKWLNPQKQAGFRISFKQHAVIAGAIVLLAFALKAFMAWLEFKDLIFMDLLLAAGSITATFLEIRKETSCWIYWMVCNLAYACVYAVNPSGAEPMYLYAALMLFLAVFSGVALRQWQAIQNQGHAK